jgi:hypothetical protein
MKPQLLLVLFGGLLGLSGCSDSRNLRRFHMPAGNVERGQAAFVALKCTTCHTVTGVPALPPPTVTPASQVVLGGDVIRLRTYGDLLTAIVHPNYSLSEKMRWVPGEAVTRPDSAMPVVNDVMTVTQLIDLVTFLQPRYTELRPLYYDFGL